MRRSLSIILAIVAILGVAGPASASSGAPPDSVLDFAAGEVCPFALRLEDWSTDRTWTVTGRDGVERTVSVGHTRTRVTDLDRGRSVSVDYASVLTYWEPGDGTFRLQMTGSQLFYFLDGDQNPRGDGPGLFLVIGSASETLDLTTGVVTSFQQHGLARDLCARLG